MKNIRRWLPPVILAIIVQQAIRLVTDISMDNTFWITPAQHLKEFFISIPFFYFLDWRIRKFLKDSKYEHNNRKQMYKEYILWMVYLFFGVIISVFIIHQILDLPDYLRDYVFAVATTVPILLLYYIWIKNSFIENRFTEQIIQMEKLKTEKLETDMKFLKAQYHPHFLFNALNTIYFQVDDDNDPAKESIELLSDLLRYQIYNSDTQVTLKHEINFIQTYIRFQKLRMESNVTINQYIDTDDNEIKIHPLLFQPLLENAFKHLDGELQIDFYVTQQVGKIVFTVINSIAGFDKTEKNKGIGIDNLKQRLSILYPGKHELTTEVEGKTFHAQLAINPN